MGKRKDATQRRSAATDTGTFCCDCKPPPRERSRKEQPTQRCRYLEDAHTPRRRPPRRTTQNIECSEARSAPVPWTTTRLSAIGGPSHQLHFLEIQQPRSIG